MWGIFIQAFWMRYQTKIFKMGLDTFNALINLFCYGLLAFYEDGCGSNQAAERIIISN